MTHLRTIIPILASIALTPLATAAQNSAEQISNYQKLSPADSKSLLEATNRANFRKIPADQKLQIQKAALKASASLIGKNNKGQLKTVKDETQKQILKIAGDYLDSLPTDKIPAHPAAQDLFGKIPANAPRIAKSITIDPDTVRWHSTGLYAAPGEIVTITIPQAWIDKGLKIQLSGHRDKISTKKNLQRLPTSPAKSIKVKSTQTKIAGPFGGAIYIDTGDTSIKAPPFTVKIENALQAPIYTLGKTTPAQWATLKNAPAPYAEIVTPRIALSFPSEWIRTIEDPTELAKYWDHVVELHDQLGGMAHVRKGPERVNVDVQISVGLFHAGYPAQGPQKQCRGVVDLPKLKTQGNWGWFHEMGHESQRRPDKAWTWNNPYTFDGSVEVTVNLFSAHAMDTLGMKQRGGWSWTAFPEQVTARARKLLTSGKKYPQMGAGEKLIMFLLIRDEFGWDPIHKTLKAYSDLQTKDPTKLPKTNQQKRDHFALTISNTTGKNLAPYMEKIWGIPISPETTAKTKHLPTWIPKALQK